MTSKEKAQTHTAEGKLKHEEELSKDFQAQGEFKLFNFDNSQLEQKSRSVNISLHVFSKKYVKFSSNLKTFFPGIRMTFEPSPETLRSTD